MSYDRAVQTSLTYENVSNLPYLDNVIKEVLRMYPLASG